MEVSAICHIYTTDTEKFSFSENFCMYGKISKMVQFYKTSVHTEVSAICHIYTADT